MSNFLIRPMNELERRLLRRIYRYAEDCSDDTNTQNGAVVVVRGGQEVFGTNGFPDGVAKTPERLARPAKYDFMVHAEQMSILNCCSMMHSTEDAVMYAAWAPCLGCARAIIQSGIIKVVAHREMHERGSERWDAEINRAIDLLAEAGIVYEQVSGKVGGCKNRFDDVEWEP